MTEAVLKPAAQPLGGLRVVDFTTLLPGPLATLLMRRAGAEVIKVEPPGGDPMRELLNDGGEAFGLLNRGKRSISANLKNAGELAAVRRLCDSADVVVEQFRPGVMDRLGLGCRDLRRDRPSLVYCSITGYGGKGPLRDLAGHDINYLAESGLLDLFANAQGQPAPPPVLLADVVGGAYPAFSNILLALFQRMRNGQGAHLDIAMTRGLQALSVAAVARHGGVPPADSTVRLDGSEANYRCYRCADGGWLAVGSLEHRFWTRLVELIGLESSMRNRSPTDPAVIAAVAGCFALRPVAHWIERFAGEDVCCARVRPFGEVIREMVSHGTREFALPLPLAPCFDSGEGSEAPVLGEANTRFLGEF
jgi:alpha-methylacyl-CoA racemase